MDQFGAGEILWLAIYVFGVVLTIAWIVLPFALIGNETITTRTHRGGKEDECPLDTAQLGLARASEIAARPL